MYKQTKDRLQNEHYQLLKQADDPLRPDPTDEQRVRMTQLVDLLDVGFGKHSHGELLGACHNAIQGLLKELTAPAEDYPKLSALLDEVRDRITHVDRLNKQ